MNISEQVERAIAASIHKGVEERLTGYNSPLKGIVEDSIKVNDGKIRDLLYGAVRDCLDEGTFRESMKDEVRRILARALIQKFGGEMESQINKLKADPATRARITLAIDQIIKGEV